MEVVFFSENSRDSPNRRGVSKTNEKCENSKQSLRRTRPSQHIVLHVQYNMRFIRHNFGIQV